MIDLIVASVAICFISITIAMVGRRGGNYYVPILVAPGLPIHQAATTIENAEKIAKELAESRVRGLKGKGRTHFDSSPIYINLICVCTHKGLDKKLAHRISIYDNNKSWCS